MKKQQQDSFEKAKEYIIKAGFSHIKIEMEADLGRECDDYECDECCGSGTIECFECCGDGVVSVTRPNGSTLDVECNECDGDGLIECDECCGSGRQNGEDWDENACEEFIKNYVSDDVRNSLTYSKFYYDGSVDSEMTLTIPVKNAEYLVDYLKAFKALSEEIGNGLEVGGAGLHLTVIPESAKGSYPAPSSSLPSVQFENFKNQVTKLLPALFMLASPNSETRGLGYRKPQISSDDKYSAIYAYGMSSLEYRLFETCYDEPETVKEYIEVIAKTLKYYVDPSLKVDSLDKTFGLSEESRKVSRFYNNSEKINILRTQLKHIKPDGKKVSELMKKRDIPNVTELKKLQSAKKAQLAKQWLDNKRKNELLMKEPLTPEQHMSKIEYMSASFYGMNEQQAEARARNLTIFPNLEEYINKHFNNNYDNYSVTV